MDDLLVTPKGRSLKVWQHFGFRKKDKEGKKAVWQHFGFCKEDKEGKKEVCKICKAGVVHAGGTTNLKTHLYT